MGKFVRNSKHSYMELILQSLASQYLHYQLQLILWNLNEYVFYLILALINKSVQVRYPVDLIPTLICMNFFCGMKWDWVFWWCSLKLAFAPVGVGRLKNTALVKWQLARKLKYSKKTLPKCHSAYITYVYNTGVRICQLLNHNNI
jgi:hypothetical protein